MEVDLNVFTNFDLITLYLCFQYKILVEKKNILNT